MPRICVSVQLLQIFSMCLERKTCNFNNAPLLKDLLHDNIIFLTFPRWSNHICFKGTSITDVEEIKQLFAFFIPYDLLF